MRCQRLRALDAVYGSQQQHRRILLGRAEAARFASVEEMKRGRLWAPVAEPSGRSGFSPSRRSEQFQSARIATIVAAVITSNLRIADAPGNVRLAGSGGGLSKASVVNVSQLITLTRRHSRADWATPSTAQMAPASATGVCGCARGWVEWSAVGGTGCIGVGCGRGKRSRCTPTHSQPTGSLPMRDHTRLRVFHLVDELAIERVRVRAFSKSRTDRPRSCSTRSTSARVWDTWTRSAEILAASAPRPRSR